MQTRLRQVIAAAGDRLKVAGDVLDFAAFFLPDEQLPYDEAAFEKQLRDDEAAARLARFRERLAEAESFDAAAVEQTLQKFLADEQIVAGKIIHAIRVAATGKTVGFGLFETLATLGRESSLARIDRALARRAPGELATESTESTERRKGR